MIDSINDFSAKAKMEMVAFLQPFFAQVKQKGMGGGITEVTSGDGSITVTDSTGPTVDVAVTDPGIRFNVDNEGGWLDIGLGSSADPHGLGMRIDDPSEKGMRLQSPHSAVDIERSVQITGSTSAGTPTTAELDIGTAGSADVVAYVKDFLVHAGATAAGATTGGFKVFDHSDVLIFVARDAGGQNEVGFFNVGPVTQQAEPTTINEIVDLLQAFGLSA